MTEASTTLGKTIGVLTSGGDCAGLNAVIRAVVARAVLGYGWHVVGIYQGTQGLLRRPVASVPLDLGNATPAMARMAGTILGTTNRGDPFAYPMPDGTLKDRSEEVIEGVRLLGLDALIGIGGDGSMAILRHLAQQGGIPFIGIPKTIDNDVGATETSVGYDTAVMVATEAIDRLQPTAASHDRVMVLEVMGRDSGHIALAAGIAGGADVILVPEIPTTSRSSPPTSGACARARTISPSSWSPRRCAITPASAWSGGMRSAAPRMAASATCSARRSPR